MSIMSDINSISFGIWENKLLVSRLPRICVDGVVSLHHQGHDEGHDRTCRPSWFTVYDLMRELPLFRGTCRLHCCWIYVLTQAATLTGPHSQHLQSCWEYDSIPSPRLSLRRWQPIDSSAESPCSTTGGPNEVRDLSTLGLVASLAPPHHLALSETLGSTFLGSAAAPGLLGSGRTHLTTVVSASSVAAIQSKETDQSPSLSMVLGSAAAHPLLGSHDLGQTPSATPVSVVVETLNLSKCPSLGLGRGLSTALGSVASGARMVSSILCPSPTLTTLECVVLAQATHRCCHTTIRSPRTLPTTGSMVPPADPDWLMTTLGSVLASSHHSLAYGRVRAVLCSTRHVRLTTRPVLPTSRINPLSSSLSRRSPASTTRLSHHEVRAPRRRVLDGFLEPVAELRERSR